MLLAPIRSFIGFVSRTNQSVVFVLWLKECSKFNEVTDDSERAIRKVESSFRLRNVGFSVFLACILPHSWEIRCYWTDERYRINLRKRVTHVVKMVDSSRENGARSWLLFLHDESEWKNFESSIA